MKTRIRKEKTNKRNRVREEEELTEEWPDGLKNETKCRRMSAGRQEKQREQTVIRKKEKKPTTSRQHRRAICGRGICK